MKTIPTSVLVLLVSASAALLQASQEPRLAPSDPLIAFGANPAARVGLSRAALIEQIGAPTVQLNPDVWAYWEFRAEGRPAGEHNALIVVFTADRVSLLRLTTRADVEVALSRLRAAAPKLPVIARK
jgi:hypothetical protein